MGSPSVRLPRPGRLASTGPVDAVEQYFHGGMGVVLRWRLRWVAGVLDPRPLDRVLEIGYGSGIFQYELSARARWSVGVDVHDAAAAVRAALAADGIRPQLLRADGMALPFADDAFDAVVIVSALEFMDDPARCLDEAARVTRPGGRVVFVTPRILPWADRLYRMLSGIDPESDFQGGRARVQAALARPRPGMRRLTRPAGAPAWLAPYEVVVLERS
jgi:SAM-dependent methyltransferase